MKIELHALVNNGGNVEWLASLDLTEVEPGGGDHTALSSVPVFNKMTVLYS